MIHSVVFISFSGRGRLLNFPIPHKISSPYLPEAAESLKLPVLRIRENATGHSAHDTFRRLHSSGVLMEAKGIAVGVRLEHPQVLIDRLQYHSESGRGKYLPPAEYNYVTQVEGRGVYSFCMCPECQDVHHVAQEAVKLPPHSLSSYCV